MVRCCVNTDVELETATNACGDISVDSSRPDRTPRKLLDVSRLAKLGWRAATSLHDGLKSAYAAYQAGAPVAARE
ncbi:nucleoside-diphosphate-sugar epimerase [Bradyrhizobium sp. I1.8.5]